MQGAEVVDRKAPLVDLLLVCRVIVFAIFEVGRRVDQLHFALKSTGHHSLTRARKTKSPVTLETVKAHLEGKGMPGRHLATWAVLDVMVYSEVSADTELVTCAVLEGFHRGHSQAHRYLYFLVHLC